MVMMTDQMVSDMTQRENDN